MSIDRENFHSIMHLLQLSDSALPVGGFSFSNTLESAIAHGLVGDDKSLEAYVGEALRGVALSDGVAALCVRRYALEGLRDEIVETDKMLLRSKLNDESRQMSLRMGRKLAELSHTLNESEMTAWWRASIDTGDADGTYASTQGIVAALCGIGARELFCSLCYGAASMMLGAALRTMRTTHLATQRILFGIAHRVGDLYSEANQLSPNEMNIFTPEMDIMAALHEKGQQRLFMN